ncbi:MAG TPA: hypothetical protein VIK11_10970 [Tepidiformaceae bacterium]
MIAHTAAERQIAPTAHRRVHVLGHGAGVDAADVEEGFPADDRTGPAPEGGIVAVLAGHDAVVEDGLLVPWLSLVFGAAVLEGVDVVVRLGRLDEGYLRVAKVAEEFGQEVLKRGVIRIEDCDEVAASLQQGRIQVPGLGATVVFACEVFRTNLFAEQPHLIAAPVIQDVGAVRVLHREGREDRRFQDG